MICKNQWTGRLSTCAPLPQLDTQVLIRSTGSYLSKTGRYVGWRDYNRCYILIKRRPIQEHLPFEEMRCHKPFLVKYKRPDKCGRH